ncbi:MAG: cupin domain-containing protein [Ktedonobacteraceae bacterium]|nr:cupin domain-containing protein [Ktedonobacteraceae bacterium]
MKLLRTDGRKFRWDGLVGWAYNETTVFPNASAAYIETTASHGRIKNTRSDIVYYVIEGSGKFLVNDQWVPVEQHDVVIIPRETTYDFEAIDSTLKLFLVHTPAYHPDFDIKDV